MSRHIHTLHIHDTSVKFQMDLQGDDDLDNAFPDIINLNYPFMPYNRFLLNLKQYCLCLDYHTRVSIGSSLE
jgi:hypothetical protein